MARTKISEFSATPANNTDIDSINLAEGCAPSGINDAIRELMSQLKDFQAGTAGDSFNGPVGTTTAATGAFTNLTASGTLGVTGATTLSSALTYGGVTLSNAVTGTGNMVLSNSPTLVTPALGTPASGVVTNLTGTASININGTVGATTATTGAFTTLAASGAVTLSGGTANGVAYLNGSKVLTSGSALTFDGAQLNVVYADDAYAAGLRVTNTRNTASSQAKIYAVNNAGDYVSLGRNSAALGSQSAIFSTGAYPLDFYTDSTLRMSLTSTGLGIGTSSPGYRLTVQYDAAVFAGSCTILMSAQGGAYGSLGTTSNHKLVFATNNTEKATLDTSGNLGLGVTPSAWGAGKAMEFNTKGNAIWGLGTNSMWVASNVYFDGSYKYANNDFANLLRVGSNNGQIQFLTAPSGTAGNAISFTQAMTLDASGNLLVGTTSAGAMITAKTQTAAGSALATLGTSGDTPFQAVLVTKFDNDSTTSQNFIQFQINNGGANCGKIVANGANTAAFASTSDARAKENITDLPSQLGNILALRPVEFDYIPALGGGHQVGFIAQEMQQVFPDAVSGDGTEENILAITGWSKTEARLVKAIQDQQAIITALTARVAALEVA